MLLGPIVGSLLYYAGGYFLPFAVLGGAYFLIWPVITSVLVKLRNKAADSPMKVRKQEGEKVSQMKLMSNARFLFGLKS